jgi:hypothetical protein
MRPPHPGGSGDVGAAAILGAVRRTAVLVLVLLVVVPAGFSLAASAPRELPLRGTTDRGQEWRLRAAKPPADDDVASSWCLNLGYTTGVIIDGDKYSGGLTSCGRRPARRISGMIAADCERGSVFVYGAVRRGVRQLPAWLTAEGVGENALARIPRQSQLCEPYPGAPAGGQPFADFESRK